jgi:hypothetical protein
MERSDYQKRVLVGLQRLLLHLDGRPKRLGHEGRNLATMSAIDSKTDTVVQEPTEQPYGVRDCAFCDPAGNLLRIQEPRRAARWTRGARSQQRKEQA